MILANILTYEPSVLLGAVVDQTLTNLLVQVGAEVVSLQLPRHVVRVEMKPNSSKLKNYSINNYIFKASNRI